jgi:hypothetical protein
VTNLDIAALIITQHDEFRRSFATIESRLDRAEVRTLWDALNAKLETHAAAEEAIFYPALLQDVDDTEHDTEHAIKDHNEIRQTTSAVDEHEVGTDDWWSAFKEARDATIEHLDEEERDVFPPFQAEVPEGERTELGRRWLEFHEAHEGAEGLSGAEKDPEEYVEEHTA